MPEVTIAYKKVKSVSYDKETGEICFHKSYYTINEVKDALTVIELNQTMEEANDE